MLINSIIDEEILIPEKVSRKRTADKSKQGKRENLLSKKKIKPYSQKLISDKCVSIAALQKLRDVSNLTGSEKTFVFKFSNGAA
jgi:hypothetical protein